jgi:flavin reductase (DIM6/NTAB) family NADH-FMN oxidoreductase RutF
MHVDFGALAPGQKYKLITASVIPRPIAFITTLNEDGSCNAAPFSAFNYVSDDPPLVVLGMQVYPQGGDRSGEVKDTLRNIMRSGEFVINFVDETLLEPMVGSAADFPRDESEIQAFALDIVSSSRVKSPRLAKSLIAMECRLWKVTNVSQTRAVVFGEILSMHFRDDLFDVSTSHINLEKYRPVGRLFGSLYVRLTDLLSIPTRTHAQLVRALSKADPKLPQAE